MIRNLSVVLVLAAINAVVPTPATSQVAEDLDAGVRVRVWLTRQPSWVEGAAEEQRVRGTLTAVSPDSLTVSMHPGAAPVALAWPAVSRLDRSKGVQSRLASALLRGLQGAALGALEFALLDEQQGLYSSTRKAMLVGAATGAGIGIAWGGLHPQERWSRVRLVRP